MTSQASNAALENRNAGAAYDSKELRAALEAADPIILLMVLTHVTGDMAMLESVQPFIRKAREQQPGDIPSELSQAVRDALFDVLRDGAPAARTPSQDAYTKMISACVGETVPPEYVRMLLG